MVVVSAVALAMACVGFVSTASADPTPLTRAVDSYRYVVDGTDIYYLREKSKVSRGGRLPSYKTQVVRASFLDKSRSVIAEFEARKTGFADELVAGGGYVFVSFYDDGFDIEGATGESTRIIRISRDGASRQEVAKGALRADEEGSVVVVGNKAMMNDCGTTVAAEAASAAGSVVIRETTQDRNSKPCGGKKNVDHNRYYELRPDGATREVVTTTQRVIAKYKVRRDGSWSGTHTYKGREANSFAQVGDRVLYAYGVGGELWVRDLSTGTTTGPYVSGPLTKFAFQIGTLDLSGRLALISVDFPKGSDRREDVKVKSGVFATPGDAKSFTEISDKLMFIYCGSHLIGIGPTKVVELDPVTYAVRRTVSTHTGDDGIDLTLGCTDRFLYQSEVRGKRPDLLTAIPLD